MSRRTLALLLLMLTAVAGIGAQSPAKRDDRVPVLAELFTSEGCNSCPPADALLEMWMQQQPVAGVYLVALSEHVTYWDNQGWKDPFDSPQFTTRQQQYGLRFSLESIYTPQLIVDGGREFVGSDKRAVERALADAAKRPKPAVHVDALVDGAVVNASASGDGVAADKDAELWFALTEDHLVVDVKRGENANRTLRHSGVVRTLQSAGSLDVSSKRVSLKLSPEWKRDNLRMVVFVQSKKDRRIIGVGVAPLTGG